MEYEIQWNKSHIKKLHQQRKNPSLFHRNLTSHAITQDRIRHFKEHVIEAIPFHQNILEVHEKRMELIKRIMPLRKYRKLVRISRKYGGTAEYFVFDKLHKQTFFVIEHFDENKKKWMEKVKELIEVIVLDKLP